VPLVEALSESLSMREDNLLALRTFVLGGRFAQRLNEWLGRRELTPRSRQFLKLGIFDFRFDANLHGLR